MQILHSEALRRAVPTRVGRPSLSSELRLRLQLQLQLQPAHAHGASERVARLHVEGDFLARPAPDR